MNCYTLNICILVYLNCVRINFKMKMKKNINQDSISNCYILQLKQSCTYFVSTSQNLQDIPPKNCIDFRHCLLMEYVIFSEINWNCCISVARVILRCLVFIQEKIQSRKEQNPLGRIKPLSLNIKRRQWKDMLFLRDNHQ